MLKIDLNLEKITAVLESLEETIIFKLIDRAQFKYNRCIYIKGKSGFKGENESLFSLRLKHQESIDSIFGRFCVPEERPFCKNLPKPRRQIKLPDTGIRISDYNKVNLTQQIKASYLKLVPRICLQGTDGHFGSSVEHDVYALQAISRRIHFGAFYVAESKFRLNPKLYTSLIQKKDKRELFNSLTRKDVEEKILKRVKEKVISFQSNANKTIRHIVEPEEVLMFYENCIIPLTKQGEIIYLLNREMEDNK
jgi:chorismate mutase